MAFPFHEEFTMSRSKTIERMSIGDIKKIYEDKIARLRILQQEHQRLSEELKAVELEIRRMGGNMKPGKKGGIEVLPTGSRTRPQNQRPLHAFIREVLETNKKGMRPAEIAKAVQSAGYRTSSAKFYSNVYQQLLHMVRSGDLVKEEQTRTYRLNKG
jgi:hypothetical protein